MIKNNLEFLNRKIKKGTVSVPLLIPDTLRGLKEKELEVKK